jgi:hypothetical protein
LDANYPVSIRPSVCGDVYLCIHCEAPVSLKSAFHTLLDEVHLPNEDVRNRIREEVDVKDVPDTVPDDKPEPDEKEGE